MMIKFSREEIEQLLDAEVFDMMRKYPQHKDLISTVVDELYTPLVELYMIRRALIRTIGEEEANEILDTLVRAQGKFMDIAVDRLSDKRG